ncbi:TMV resistance protein N-like [Cynara cardunculus var. scolymus]|uniref:TMV resistance protein N-like n=1 Tax=Cynara cardunculus var. scolymus TaxID=59895 RepID=UPI000D624613|nr:TMV resistance protein N-like [Cynara cardunculus var. scolymus]
MATTSAQRHRWTYDVFVSFRGEDIRKSFMDHLFKDFGQKGIHAFRDDKDLNLGEKISPNLDKVIEESRFLIVIFSKNYASSSWCLRELVKILKCMETGEHKHEVRIIFFDVKPDAVRKQTRSFAEAFAKHEISNRTEVAKWKEALFMAANLSGWDLQDMANGFESKFIDSISKEILKALCHEPLHVGENLVGVDACVNEMNLLRFVGSGNVHMIGICGISGIGKTTLAKAIYNSMSIHFEECSFCEDVQEVAKQQGLTQVQMQLIGKIMKTRVVEISSVSEGIMVIKERMPTKPILLVLDDVDHRDQLEALAGSPNWFFPGSFIIFTGEDKQLLWSHKVDEIYEMPTLPDYKALELFSMYAFGQHHPIKDFEGLSYQVVKCLQGHPLALKVLGCCLYDKPRCVWLSEVDRLQKYPNTEIQQKLQPSFDGLDYSQKRIFLDIACSFIGENKDFTASVLDNADCFVYADMEAIEAVEVLALFLEESTQNVHIEGDAFEDMKNLRILKICDTELGNLCHPFKLKLWKESKVNYSGRLKSLSNKLRLLYWHGCPFEFPSSFYPENIVAIDLSYSYLRTLWTTSMCFGRLKVMNLRHCRNLTSTPDFTGITNLKELILEGCVNLVKVHPSFGILKRLVVLNMRGCKRFRRFPCKVEMDSLEVMNLSGCSKVHKLPEFFRTIQILREVCVDGTSIMELPSFIFSQCNLQVLKFGRLEENRSRWWTSISQPSWLPSKMQHPQRPVMTSLAGLRFLQELDLSYCNILEVSDSIGGLSCLESLYLSHNNIMEVSDSIGRLSCLQILSLDGNNFTNLPSGCLSQLSRLQFLGLSDCKELEVLPELPPNLLSLDARDCTSLQGPPSYNNHLSLSTHFNGCRKLFRNLSIERQVCMSQPQPYLNSSITSHSCRNRFSSLIQYMKFPSNTCEIFKAQETHDIGRDTINMVYHGNSIPQWFTNQSMGNSVKVELPPDWCYNKFRGYGICVVFTPKKSYGSKDYYYTPKYYVNNFDGSSLVERYPYIYDCIGIPKSDIIWFRFTINGSQKWMKANNFVTFSFEDNDDFEVKECGIRLVFDEDIQGDETNLSITRDLPTPTQDGGDIHLWRNARYTCWSW